MSPNDTGGSSRTLVAIERLAVIATALFVAYQTRVVAEHTVIFTALARTAAQAYTSSVDAQKTDRSADWAAKIREPRMWENLSATLQYFRSEADAAKKIRRIEGDPKFQDQFYSSLAFMEDLGYLYNADKIDREFIKKSPAGAIIEFYDNSQFWIQHRRIVTQQPALWVEFEKMAVDLKKH